MTVHEVKNIFCIILWELYQKAFIGFFLHSRMLKLWSQPLKQKTNYPAYKLHVGLLHEAVVLFCSEQKKSILPFWLGYCHNDDVASRYVIDF